MVAHAYNPSTGEAEAGGLPYIEGYPGLYSEHQSSQGYIARISQKQERV